MSSQFGQALRFTMHGESHGLRIGGTLEGLPAGITINEQRLTQEMARRRPGKTATSTRQEQDLVEFYAGVRRDPATHTLYTCGGPIAFTLENNDAHPLDYALNTPRPSHADLTSWYRDGAFLSGGGRFSGRLTAPMVVVGGLLRPLLEAQGVHTAGHLLQVGRLQGQSFLTSTRDPTPDELASLRAQPWPTWSCLPPTHALPNNEDRPAPCGATSSTTTLGDAMQQEAMHAATQGDSLGSQVELAVIGLPPGTGEPPFEGFESHLSQALFAVPGVKAVAFGAGDAFATLRGSEANDPIGLHHGQPYPLTNRAGGLNGGLTNGRAVIIRVTLRPTPSIALPQKTVDLDQMTEVELAVRGRHDPCLGPRALPALESATLLATADLLFQRFGPAFFVTKSNVTAMDLSPKR